MQNLLKIVCVFALLCGLAFAIPAPSLVQTAKLMQLQETLKQLGSSLMDLSDGSGTNLRSSFHGGSDELAAYLK